MKMIPSLTVAGLLLLCTIQFACAQNAELIYSERRPGLVASAKVFAHGKTSILFLAMDRLGVYTLDGTSLTPRGISNTQGADGYEYQYYGGCTNGDILLHQRGFLGSRLFRLDEQGIAHEIYVADGVLGNVQLGGNGVARAVVAHLDGKFTGYTTLDCGNSWFADSGNATPELRDAMRTQLSNPLRFNIARPGLGNQSYPSAMKAVNGLQDVAILGADSLVWLVRRSRPAFPDTVWYANIRDSNRKHFDTVLRVAGVTDSIIQSEVMLLSTYSGKVFLFHISGWYARFNGSSWTVVDTVPRPISFGLNYSDMSLSNSMFRYVGTQGASKRLVTLFLDSNGHHEELVLFETKPEPIGGVSLVSKEHTLITYNLEASPVCLYSIANGRQLLNSVVKDLEVLPLTPILFGFTDSDGTPIVVSVSDCAVKATEGGLGILHSTYVRGESWRLTQIPGPRIQSTRGLRTPFVGKEEVISPGDKVLQLTRDGKYVKTIDPGPATAVIRLEDSTLIIANQSKLKIMRPTGVVDSADITSALCTPLDSAGFISTLAHNSDGSILAFVSGLRLLNLETLVTTPLHCGGVIRSQDTGRTWTRAPMPVESPYFLGHLRTPSGTIVASVSTVVRDSTTQVSDDLEPAVESKNHTFIDRDVIRSTDNGATWTQVYHSSSQNPFRLIGGDGVVTENGTLLLMTTDGILQSTNDGIDWEFYTVEGIGFGTKIISMFQDTVRSEVYYCTDAGLYKSQRITSVVESQTQQTQKLHARTWIDHRSEWNQQELVVSRLINILGREVSLLDPTAGFYMVELSFQSQTKIEPIVILSE